MVSNFVISTIHHIFTILPQSAYKKHGTPPVQDKSMWDVNPLQVRGVVFWYAEKVQVIPLLLIADLK